MPWIPYSPLQRALISLAFLLGVAVAYRLAEWAIRRGGHASRQSRRARIVTIRNLCVVAAAGGLGFLWFPELRQVGTALALVAGGLAIATKEFWLNFFGFVQHAMTRPFAIGDRIKIGDCRGDVIDRNMMTTTLLEVGPGADSHQYSGRTVFIPNARLLDTPLINETFMRPFVFHIVRVPLRMGDDWQAAEARLLEAARHVCGPYLEKARLHVQRIERLHSLTAPTVDPMVRIQMPDSDSLHLLLRIPAPARRRSHIEQAILRRYLRAEGQADSPPPE